MGYVIAGIIVVAIIALAIAWLVTSASAHGRRHNRAAEDSEYGAGLPGSDTAIIAADDETPLGDTSEHAGRQTREGTTAEDPEGRERGIDPAAPEQRQRGDAGVPPREERPHPTPESERIANRPR